MVSVSKYVKQLQNLLPKGAAWNRDPDSTLTKLLTGIAQELFNCEVRVEDLLRESDPRTALEMLADWERVTGLPDPCTGPLDSLEARRGAVVARLGHQGGQSRAFFLSLAESLGYTVSITEYRPFVAGSPAGGVLSNGDWLHTWMVTAPETTVRKFKAGAGAGERLATWGNDELECAIERAKPAHTNVIFAYQG